MKTVAFETKEALRDALDEPSSEFDTADIVGQASIEADSELKKKTAFLGTKEIKITFGSISM